MKLTINPSWSFERTLAEARKAYIGCGKTSTGLRNSVMMAWGNIVGRERAVAELTALIKSYGSRRRLADALKLSSYSLSVIEGFFSSLPSTFSSKLQPLRCRMIVGSAIDREEDQEIEFKQVKGGNPVSSIQNTVDKYAIGFLNGEGGRILWGIRDDGSVVAVKLNRSERDCVRRAIADKISSIEPCVDPSSFLVHFHQCYAGTEQAPDLYVVELVVPATSSHYLHFSGAGETWVRQNGVTQKLRGSMIQEWILRRQCK